ncbi:Ubiquitin carboxyl-terminal hydrolase 14 [Giardia muris]|uniref:ubiquitinyl hydrolase 1 n=1 Tax=Giardia muris TaxID=5742 RepID=A0A4Z1T7P6_GIAMU|nr:Ubiquitin carboxyl-terminal hydrolase 14 [Giardia muris]|eukprot:TNJ28599.1 Ubiquitin carboxyl-terminal hydrolase 14 [Giardia muris]
MATLRPMTDDSIHSWECMYCFRNRYTPTGLFLCMHCDFCTCRDHAFIHQKQHPEHVYWFQIARHLRIAQETLPKEGLMHIVAGDDDDEIADYQTAVYHFKAGALTPLPPEEVTDELNMCATGLISASCNIDSIIFRQTTPSNVVVQQEPICQALGPLKQHILSVNKSPLEKRPNSHSSSSTTEITPETQQIFKCHDCDLTENLWLCLHCGFIGCGRQQPGIKGCSHMLKHHEASSTPKHALVLRLGSLCKSAHEIYCYTCDIDHDNVFQGEFYHEFAKYLQVLGGNALYNLVGRDEAVELTLNAHSDQIMLNLDIYGTAAVDAAKLFWPAGLVGPLRNTGNTCYANAVINALRACAAFDPENVDIKNSLAAHREVCPNTLGCQKCQKARLCFFKKEEQNADSTLILNSKLPIFVLYSVPHLSHYIRCYAPELVTADACRKQQDASEFLYSVLARDEEIRRSFALPALRKETICRMCGWRKYVLEEAETTTLQLNCIFIESYPEAEGETFADMTQALTDEFIGRVGTPDGFRCDACGAQNMTGTERIISLGYHIIASPDVDRLPPCLIVVANRAYYNVATGAIQKLQTALLNTEQIDLRQLIAVRDSQEDLKKSKEAWSRLLNEQSLEGSDDVDQVMNICNCNREVAVAALLRWRTAEEAIPRILSESITEKAFFEEEYLETLRCNDEAPRRESVETMDTKYKLRAIVEHRGMTVDSGHYVAYISLSSLTDAERNQVFGVGSESTTYPGAWLVIDDDKITIADEAPVAAGYLYFYVRMRA